MTCRNILPYYRKAQSHQEGESTYRGGGGFWWLGGFRADSGRQVDPKFLALHFPEMIGFFGHSRDFYKSQYFFKRLDREDLPLLVSLGGPIRSSMKPPCLHHHWRFRAIDGDSTKDPSSGSNQRSLRACWGAGQRSRNSWDVERHDVTLCN